MQSGFGQGGPVFAFAGLTCRLDLVGHDVARRATIIEITAEPGAGAPAHISRGEDKYFRVLRGRFLFHVDGVSRLLTAGAVVSVARGSVHAFANVDSGPSALLLVSTPAGQDRFFAQLAALAEPQTLEGVLDVCARNGQELVF